MLGDSLANQQCRCHRPGRRHYPFPITPNQDDNAETAIEPDKKGHNISVTPTTATNKTKNTNLIAPSAKPKHSLLPWHRRITPFLTSNQAIYTIVAFILISALVSIVILILAVIIPPKAVGLPTLTPQTGTGTATRTSAPSFGTTIPTNTAIVRGHVCTVVFRYNRNGGRTVRTAG